MKRINNEHKQHLLNPEGKRTQNQNQRLAEAIQIGSEAEIEARDIKVNMEGQSRTLQHANDNVHRINGNLTQGSNLIDAMRKHEMRNKLLLLCIILILILGVVILGFFMLK